MPVVSPGLTATGGLTPRSPERRRRHATRPISQAPDSGLGRPDHSSTDTRKPTSTTEPFSAINALKGINVFNRTIDPGIHRTDTGGEQPRPTDAQAPSLG